MLSVIEFTNVFADVGTADTSMALNLCTLGLVVRLNTLRYSPRARMTDWICVASSLVGERMRA